MKGKFSLRTCKCAQFAKLTYWLSRGYPNASRGNPNASEINAKKVISAVASALSNRQNCTCTGDNHVTCGQLSKPDVATLSYRRSHYWWEKER